MSVIIDLTQDDDDDSFIQEHQAGSGRQHQPSLTPLGKRDDSKDNLPSRKRSRSSSSIAQSTDVVDVDALQSDDDKAVTMPTTAHRQYDEAKAQAEITTLLLRHEGNDERDIFEELADRKIEVTLPSLSNGSVEASSAGDNASPAPPNIFVPSRQGMRSPFVRGLPTGVVLRRRRLEECGIHILRLPRLDVITDNGSIFDAFVVTSPALTKSLIEDCVAEIRSDERVAMAAHPTIYAYRIASSEDPHGIVEGSDDNGEQYAAAKILNLLRTHRLHHCLVVVTRWFGGRLLGPRRFTHVYNVAKRVLERNGIIPEGLPF